MRPERVGTALRAVLPATETATGRSATKNKPVRRALSLGVSRACSMGDTGLEPVTPSVSAGVTNCLNLFLGMELSCGQPFAPSVVFSLFFRHFSRRPELSLPISARRFPTRFPLPSPAGPPTFDSIGSVAEASARWLTLSRTS